MVSSESITGLKDSGNNAVTASFALTYDAGARVISRTQTVPTAASGSLNPNGTWTYGYDAASRMTSVTPPSGSGLTAQTYLWDGAGNRVSTQAGAQTPVTVQYGSRGLPLAASDGTSFSFDAPGELKTESGPSAPAGSASYGWDAWGDLATETVGTGGGATTLNSAFDALGRMATRGTTSYLYRGSGESPVAATTSGATVNTSWGPAGPIAHKTVGQSASLRLLIQDLHTDIVADATSNGVISGTVAYDAWGGVLSSGGTSLAKGDLATRALGFQGDPTDPASGVIDMGSRLYDPSQGRFLSQDSLFGQSSDPASYNQYGYAGGSPIAYTDPTGMMRYCGEYCSDTEQSGLGRGSGSDNRRHDFSGTGTAGDQGSAAPPPMPIVIQPTPGGQTLSFTLVSATIPEEGGQALQPGLGETGAAGGDAVDGEGTSADTSEDPENQAKFEYNIRTLNAERQVDTLQELFGRIEEETTGDVVFRDGTRSLKDLSLRPGEQSLSARESLSDPTSGPPVFRRGFVAIDTGQLPEGSWAIDTPDGHVSIYVEEFGLTPEDIRAATIYWRKF